MAQALAKANPKALHPFWAALLPVDRPLAARPTSRTLMDAVAADPIPQVHCGLFVCDLSLLYTWGR
jgi:hypothetical protein